MVDNQQQYNQISANQKRQNTWRSTQEVAGNLGRRFQFVLIFWPIWNFLMLGDDIIRQID